MSTTMPEAKDRDRASRSRASSSKRAALTVLLVDDHPLWRDTLRKVLERNRFATVVGEAADGDEAVRQATALAPDVVVMDIQMPDRDGIQATRDVVSARPDARVLVLASSDKRAQVIAAVEAGASGYLIKTAGSDEVREAVRRVSQGELVFPPALSKLVLEELRRGARDGTRAPEATDDDANVFRREGDYWTVRFGGEVFRLKDTRGVRFLSQLLHDPGREFHALDLVNADRRDAGLVGSQDAGPVLDAEAKTAFRRRLAELEEELRESEEWQDLARADRVRDEIDALQASLRSAVGLGGRDRRAASTAERARVNVTLAIRSTLAKIAEYAPALSEHLASTVRTGTYCSYLPDPRAPIDWG